MDTDIRGDKLLLAEHGIEVKSYHDRHEKTDWLHCSLRKWLNNDCLETMLTKEEIDRIKPVRYEVENIEDIKNIDLEDRLFCLNRYQVEKYVKKGIKFLQCDHIDSNYIRTRAENNRKFAEFYHISTKENVEKSYNRAMQGSFVWWLSDVATDSMFLEKINIESVYAKLLYNARFSEYGIKSGRVYLAYGVNDKGRIEKFSQYSPINCDSIRNVFFLVRPAMWVKCE